MLLQWLESVSGPEVRNPENMRMLEGVVAQQMFSCLPGAQTASPPMQNPLALLAGVSRPVRAVIPAGAGDEATTRVEAAFREVPNFRLVKLPGATTNCPLEAGDALGHVISQCVFGP